MSINTKASRPRPRVALVGVFVEGISNKIKELFPTVWIAKDYEELSKKISYKEIDLLILNGTTLPPDWCNEVHLITFSNYMAYVPGPNMARVTMEEISSTEEYSIPKLGLAVNNLLQRDLARLSSAKNLRLLKFKAHANTQASDDQVELDIFFNGALFYDPHTNQPYATMYVRSNPKKGMAILPNRLFDKISWIKLISTLWADIDSDTFANFSDWHSDPTWLSKDELEIRNQIETLLKKKDEIIFQTEIKIQDLNKMLIDKSVEANQGIRRLLTSQGNDLVDEVEKTFKDFGFTVQNLDKDLKENQPKREDLRLTDTSDENWVAIVEVRGYAKSAGQTSDLLRLNRFAELYFNEKG